MATEVQPHGVVSAFMGSTTVRAGLRGHLGRTRKGMADRASWIGDPKAQLLTATKWARHYEADRTSEWVRAIGDAADLRRPPPTHRDRAIGRGYGGYPGGGGASSGAPHLVMGGPLPNSTAAPRVPLANLRDPPPGGFDEFSPAFDALAAAERARRPEGAASAAFDEASATVRFGAEGGEYRARVQRLKEENDAEKARLEEELKKASAALAAREAHEQALQAREGRGMYDQWLESGLKSQSGWSGRVEEAETGAGRVRAFNWHGRELFVVAPNAAAVEAAGHEEAKS